MSVFPAATTCLFLRVGGGGGVGLLLAGLQVVVVVGVVKGGEEGGVPARAAHCSNAVFRISMSSLNVIKLELISKLSTKCKPHYCALTGLTWKERWG